jgi:hypothetical protein
MDLSFFGRFNRPAAIRLTNPRGKQTARQRDPTGLSSNAAPARSYAPADLLHRSSFRLHRFTDGSTSSFIVPSSSFTLAIKAADTNTAPIMTPEIKELLLSLQNFGEKRSGEPRKKHR